jgi:hypothetical protein
MRPMTAVPEVRRKTAAGVMFALMAAGIGGALPVYVGHMVQGLDPILLLFAVSIVAIVLFNAIQLRAPRRYFELIRSNFREVVYLNVVTLLGWVSSFGALRFVEPVLSNSASVGLEPVATLGLTLLLRKQASTILRSDVIASFAMLATAVVQIIVMWSGLSGLGNTSHSWVVVGIICVFVNGFANGALTVMPKGLFDGGMTRSQILACRTFLLAIGCLIYILIVRPPLAPLREDLLGVGAAFLGIVGTLYLIQAAIQFAEPVTVTLICALNPIIALGLQSFDPRLAFSAATLVTTVVMIALVMWSTLEQLRRKP